MATSRGFLDYLLNRKHDIADAISIGKNAPAENEPTAEENSAKVDRLYEEMQERKRQRELSSAPTATGFEKAKEKK